MNEKQQQRFEKRAAHERAMSVRRFIVSGVYALLIVGILLYLTFINVPSANEKIINLVLGVVLATGTMASRHLFENPTDPNEELQEELDRMNHRYAKTEAKLEIIHEEHTKLVKYLVDAYTGKDDRDVLSRMTGGK